MDIASPAQAGAPEQTRNKPMRTSGYGVIFVSEQHTDQMLRKDCHMSRLCKNTLTIVLVGLTAAFLGGCLGDSDASPGTPGQTLDAAPPPPVPPSPSCCTFGEGLIADGTHVRVEFGDEAGTVVEGNDLRFAATNAKLEELEARLQALQERAYEPSAGTLALSAAETAPDGWLFCDGSPLIRDDYPELFAAIGETYGAGDGVNTFVLPDCRGRTLIGAGQGNGLSDRQRGDVVGAEEHTLTIPEMPSHTHAEHPGTGTLWFQVFERGPGTWPNERSGNTLGQSTGATGGNQPHNIMQPSLTVQFIIKVR